MKSKVIIKKCEDPQRARTIAEEVAKWSGTEKGVVESALMQKDICIKKEATEEEAAALKEKFEGVGAEVGTVELAGEEVEAGASSVSAATTPTGRADDDDDEEDGRVLTDQEYTNKVTQRKDIFHVEENKRLRNLEIVCIILGLICGFWVSNYEYTKIKADFYEKMPEQRKAKVAVSIPEELIKKEKEKEEEKIETEKKKMKETKKKGAGGKTGGGGDPRARVTRKGVLGIISGKVKGKTVASADVFGKGGFASGIDAVLKGMGGLKSGGSGGSGRKGAAGIGYGAGYGSGFGGGSGGIDDLVGSLMGGEESSLGLKKSGKKLEMARPDFSQGGAISGGRSKASIRRVVMQNLPALRYAYNRRLRDKPGLGGKIICKFSIDEYGKVIFCKVVSSTINDSQLEDKIVTIIKRWNFGKIDKPGDVTTVKYPFVFSQ